MMPESATLLQAEKLLTSCTGTSLHSSLRQEKAILLASFMLEEAMRIETPAEKHLRTQLSLMVEDEAGKAFAIAVCDQSFRSKNPARIADQLSYLIQKYGVPSYLSLDKKLALKGFSAAGSLFAHFTVPLVMQMMQKEVAHLLVEGEKEPLLKFLKKKNGEGIKINLNRIGEAIQGEKQAQERIKTYLEDLANPEIFCISIKISTLYSQVHLLAWEDLLEQLALRLRELYRAATAHSYTDPQGLRKAKCINLDMEEYRDLHLTAALFRKVLDEPEFKGLEAGIALQSYLPDSFQMQQELTHWAMERVQSGGAPIKIRLVKGANLAMESYESALRLWPQAPYTDKKEVDANYKRMLLFGMEPAHAAAAHLGIATHNLFDSAYALVLRAEKGVENFTEFEMLRGMAGSMGRVVQRLAGGILLYCPIADAQEFQYAVPYLVRRFDENSAPDNFLRASFSLQSASPEWDKQTAFFTESCTAMDSISSLPRRTQNRDAETWMERKGRCFKNEPDTDWTLPHNRIWGERLAQNWQEERTVFIPLSIGGSCLKEGEGLGEGRDPSRPDQLLYTYPLASSDQIERALATADATQKIGGAAPVEERAHLLSRIAAHLRLNRGSLIGAIMADVGKTMEEADSEVSEAIDFAEYYRHSLLEWSRLSTIQWQPKGVTLVASPWNFPCSIPAGAILAALAAGNCVLFKPAQEAVLVGRKLAEIFWDAGVDPAVLQFIACKDEPEGSLLVRDNRIALAALTGETQTARLFFKLHPGLDLIAETGGKNTMLVSALADRDLAIKELLRSAFYYAGQKCSACSLAVLEAEVYDDALFLEQLKDAAASLHVGPQWDFRTLIPPLIRPPGTALLRGLTELDEGEKWLLVPRQDPANPHLWSPGIKLGVKPESFTFQTELFGPVLGLVRVASFEEGLAVINQTPYGLTAGLQSLDEREQKKWLDTVQAGNRYVNRTITGALVQRQPFGGCKESGFGKGSKAGGPNYLLQFMRPIEIALPYERQIPSEPIAVFIEGVDKAQLLADQQEYHFWRSALESYTFYWEQYFSKTQDPSLVRGQDNLQSYIPRPLMYVRWNPEEPFSWLLSFLGGALICRTPLLISLSCSEKADALKSLRLPPHIQILLEEASAFEERIRHTGRCRLRLFSPPPPSLLFQLAEQACDLHIGPSVAHGRIELLHLLMETATSADYQRYGNLGLREAIIRSSPPKNKEHSTCSGCSCHE